MGIFNPAPPPSLPLPEELLEGTNLGGGRQLERCYKASVDGWSALNFHRAVDGVGSIVITALNVKGEIIGGFAAPGFSSTDDYRSSTRAFLFFAKANAESPQVSA